MRIVLTMVAVALGFAVVLMVGVYSWQHYSIAKPVPAIAVTAASRTPATDSKANGTAKAGDKKQTTPSEPRKSIYLLDTPLIRISQQSEYPSPGIEIQYLDGLVAAMWPDGRMIRATAHETIGDFYEDGFVSENNLQRFIAMLDTKKNRPTIDNTGIPLHVAYQSFELQQDSATWNWIRVLPDSSSELSAIEQEFFRVPMNETLPIEGQAIRYLHWYQ